ncbi:MAG: hypothetical protein K2P81_03275 [Bacteriovoracaceae bacterium]|nr:hypothetical protein [Bacteriovoracaceae bacterium]
MFFLSLIFSLIAHANLRELPINLGALQNDVDLIYPSYFTLEVSTDTKNSAQFICSKNKHLIKISASTAETPSTLYKALRELGFLFPHPRWQITPSRKEIESKCGQTYSWKPTLKYRGLHLHTLHPNEWVRGFFMDKPEVALEIVRWSARNTFNILDVSLLRVPLDDISKKFSPPFELAKSLGVHTGVSLGVAFHQQNSFKLISLFEAFTGLGSTSSLKENLQKLIDALDTSFIVLEAGTSEFTGTNPKKTIEWLNLAQEIIEKNGRALFTKIHVSSNQKDEKYGNYNFLPQHAHPQVGVLPHTVMFYGLEDKIAPMYGNKNFTAIREFTLSESKKRPTWYYPETGYWVAMDVDIPLLLTDYLRTRAQDLKFLYDHQIEGQLLFSTGHGFGGWLYDWTQALLTDLTYNFDPMVGLKLLGEEPESWQKLFDYQQKHFKDLGLISMISAANLQDEFSSTHRIHDRFTMKELSQKDGEREHEISLLRSAAALWPNDIKIKDPDLSRLVLITRLRLEFALQLRESLRRDSEREGNLKSSNLLIKQAEFILAESRQDSKNYADLGMQDEWSNPTSYQFGYLYPSASLYWWKREERMVRELSFWPFTENIYDVLDIVF